MGIISTQAFTFRLLAGTPYQQLDLFNDEDIQMSNNVTGLFDIGLQPADFTRQLTIPGTKKNNAFFEQYYDISIENPFLFATNTKVPAFFEFDSLYLSQGYIQLNKVNIFQNKFVDSYEITLYGTTSSFGRDINNLFLTDLSTLSQFNHTSSYANISASWNGNLFNGDIVYPWCDYGVGWQYTSGDDFFGVEDGNGGTTVQDYKPAIRVKKVWDAIFEQTGYTYSSSFWNESWLDDVYMICNNKLRYPVYSNVDLETFGVIKLGPISGSGMTSKNIPMNTYVTLPWYNELVDLGGFLNGGLYTVTKKSNLTGVVNLNFNVSNSVNNIPGQINIALVQTGSSTIESECTLVTVNQYLSQVAQSRNGSINETFEVQAPIIFNSVDPGTYRFQIWMNEYFVTNDPTVTLDPGDTTKSYIEITKVNQAADGRIMDIPMNMPYGTVGIKLVDFITGLQRKFNLVMWPDNTKPNHFIVETFNTYYKQGEIKDFNKYINVNETIAVIPANNLAVNNLNFGDTLDTDYVSQQFYKGANREYGKSYYIDTQNFFSQGELNVQTTFASSPLLKIAGTGLSGSNGSINPVPNAYSIGQCKFSAQYDPTSTCTSPILYQNIYTQEGYFDTGVQLYFDEYSQNKVQNLKYVVNGTTGPIYNLGSTGIVGSMTGYYC